MKKSIIMCMLGAFCCIFLIGCGANTTASKPESASGNDDKGNATGSAVESTVTTGAVQSEQSSSDSTKLLDLTAMSSTMVYSEVFNMMKTPEGYIGRKIKLSGQYYASYYEETKKYYHYVVIADATACCQQGVEFIWKGKHKYPEDYPKDKTEVEISGVFNRYEEAGKTYYYVNADTLKVIK